jgi:hypothetical protein
MLGRKSLKSGTPYLINKFRTMGVARRKSREFETEATSAKSKLCGSKGQAKKKGRDIVEGNKAGSSAMLGNIVGKNGRKGTGRGRSSREWICRKFP